MTGPAGNSEHRFLGFASENIEGLGKAKLTVSLDVSHQVLIIYFLKHPSGIKLFSGTKYLLKDNFDNPRNFMSC